MEEEILQKAIEIAKVAVQAGEQHERNFKRLWVALIISILVNIILAGAFLWYKSQWTYVTEEIPTETVYTTTETTSISQDNKNGENIYQEAETINNHSEGE